MIDNTQKTITNFDFKRVFEGMPGKFVVLKPNPPHFTILAVSDDLLKTTSKSRQELEGHHLFTAFPDNPDDGVSAGTSSLKASLKQVVETKKQDFLPILRYDVTNEKGEFEERYWLGNNKPVLNEQGNIVCIIHTTEEVTNQVLEGDSIK